jgi:hypothetical protein
MAENKDTKEELLRKINYHAEQLDADFLIFNYEILPPIDMYFINAVAKRNARTNVYLILTTEGGNADSAYRMMRFLQSQYEKITVVVAGWCKSAGTLMCIGAHGIMMGHTGELGPLDVQIVKVDEMDEQKSGLVAEAAFEKLQQEAFKFFMQFVRDIGSTEYRVTLKTASDIATKMTVGVVQPIIEKLEPVTIGEDYRSNRLAQAYAERLNTHSNNLRSREIDALENLLHGYPSHGFVIDATEARQLFKVVEPFSDEIADVVRYAGRDAIVPRNRRSDQSPRLEFLNAQVQDGQQAEEISPDGKDIPKSRKRPGRGNGAGNIPRNPETGGGKVSALAGEEEI